MRLLIKELFEVLHADTVKKFYRVWQASKNKVVTYQTYCAGIDRPSWVLSAVAHQATDVVGQGPRFVQVSACESEGFKRHFIMANATHQLEPITIYHDLFQMCQPLALAGPENAPVWVRRHKTALSPSVVFRARTFRL